eukprot:SAG31_NODE_7954_length_1555_cov_2.806319_2_plen_299_part_00
MAEPAAEPTGAGGPRRPSNKYLAASRVLSAPPAPLGLCYAVRRLALAKLLHPRLITNFYTEVSAVGRLCGSSGDGSSGRQVCALPDIGVDVASTIGSLLSVQSIVGRVLALPDSEVRGAALLALPAAERGYAMYQLPAVEQATVAVALYVLHVGVGQAHRPHRCMVRDCSVSQNEWKVTGWEHQLEFYALKQQLPGTIRVAVGQAHRPHRCMINQDAFSQEEWNAGQSMTTAGWTHHLEFWAFKEARPGTIRIAVGQAHRPHRCMINHDSISQEDWNAGQSMTTAGWKHHLDFWVLES